MKIFTYGIHQSVASELKALGYTAIIQTSVPQPSTVENHVMIFSSDVVPFEQLIAFREAYRNCTLLYQYTTPGIRGYMHIHVICEKLGIHFLSPRASQESIFDALTLIFHKEKDVQGNIIGVFSSGIGIGGTSFSRTLAKRMALKGLKPVVLGLDLYDPGWYGKASVSLDVIRPRITGRILSQEDMLHWIKKEGFTYLPGNFDLVSAQDYQEEEMIYLLDEVQKAKELADVVICDFGSLPESAAWYVGLQKSNLRYYVSHPNHVERVQQHKEIMKHLHLKPSDFFLVINHADLDADLALKSFALESQMNPILEIAHYPQSMFQYTLPLGKKEIQAFDDHIQTIQATMGFNNQEIKKRGFFQ